MYEAGKHSAPQKPFHMKQNILAIVKPLETKSKTLD